MKKISAIVRATLAKTSSMKNGGLGQKAKEGFFLRQIPFKHPALHRADGAGSGFWRTGSETEFEVHALDGR